jgi:hypothetical protein
MSLKPGIGSRWLEKWRTDVYPHDYVVVNGHTVKPPRFYDRRYKTQFPDEFDQVQFKREQDGKARFEDNTPERLAVREIVTTARAQFLKRVSADGDT